MLLECSENRENMNSDDKVLIFNDELIYSRLLMKMSYQYAL